MEGKLSFFPMVKKVAEHDFKYLKGLVLECVRENPDISRLLNRYYDHIMILLFHDSSNHGIAEVVGDCLLRSCSDVPTDEMAFTTSNLGNGCIVFFMKALREAAEKREDIVNVRGYHKNGVFEELCHLVEHRGDVDVVPESFVELLNHSRNTLGHEVAYKLRRDRAHHEVYSMMVKAYPVDWLNRCWKYFDGEGIEEREQGYEQWRKVKPKIALAKLIADYLGTQSILHLTDNLSKEDLDSESESKLRHLSSSGKRILCFIEELIKRDSPEAFTALSTMDKKLYENSGPFFEFILDLWRNLHLV